MVTLALVSSGGKGGGEAQLKEDVRDSLGNQISPLRALHEAPSRAEPLSLLKLGHGFQPQFRSHFAAGAFPEWNGKNSLDKISKLNFLCWFKDQCNKRTFGLGTAGLAPKVGSRHLKMGNLASAATVPSCRFA